ncbi:flavonoid 3'-monooxygenase-like [Abrus precatorius]|uniref:Flavonoid 3'-monooxygenase-like n=1 Tax=Abrus precatorius TaxID=3816 RepID=A0A8B8JP79_ABRPR|nr:flavonoid 3'-monooxygenase-like [Abrus precatorius]
MSLQLIGFATIVAGILIYKLFKKPTKSGPSLPLPPGPRPWPIVGNLPHMGRAPHRALTALARTYGPLMHLRLGVVDVVVAASASVAEQFLKVHDDNFSSRPLNSAVKYLTYNNHDLAFATYGARWRLLRKISSVHMLSATAVDDFRHLREEEVARLACNLASSGSKAMKLGQLLNVCITNTLLEITTGRRIFNYSNGDYDPKAVEFKSMVLHIMVLLGAVNIGDFIPALNCLDLQGVQAKAKKLHERLDVFLTRIIQEHKILKSQKHRDLLSTLLLLKEAPEDGDKLTDIEIKALLSNIFVAGADTSTSTVEWAIAELIKNPRIMIRLQQELDNVVGQDRLVSELDLPHLPYLEAVVKETFRLHPPTPLSLPRVAAESCEIFGYHIPKGATLLVNIWAIGRDPNEWHDPLKFMPERFLSGGKKANVNINGNDFEVIPFGSGRRICAGMNLGQRLVQLLVGTLAHAFNYEMENGLKPDTLNMDETYRFTLQRTEPLSVHPHPRLSPNVFSSSS